MLHEFSRTELLIGQEAIAKLSASKVAVFGVGGVGGFAVEGLVRCGIGHFVLIDNDDVCITNINRQIIATHNTIGKPKVEIAKARILEINPKVEVEIHKTFYLPGRSDELVNTEFDYIVDAVDTVSAKIGLVVQAKERNIPIISSMGMGNKLNPTIIEVSDIYKTSICPLAKVIRKELRKRGIRELKVVYSKENPIVPAEYDESYGREFDSKNNEKTATNRKKIPGSISFVPSVAGLIIASEVIKDLIKG